MEYEYFCMTCNEAINLKGSYVDPKDKYADKCLTCDRVGNFKCPGDGKHCQACFRHHNKLYFEKLDSSKIEPERLKSLTEEYYRANLEEVSDDTDEEDFNIKT